MILPSLSPDDLPPAPTPLDRLLRLRLAETEYRYFVEGCDRITQVFLSRCHCQLAHTDEAFTLVIHCSDVLTYWQIVSVIEILAARLQDFADSQARIRLYPPQDRGVPFEIEVSELVVVEN